MRSTIWNSSQIGMPVSIQWLLGLDILGVDDERVAFPLADGFAVVGVAS